MSDWIKHVKAYQSQHGLTYREAMKQAGASYNSSSKIAPSSESKADCSKIKAKCRVMIASRDNAIKVLYGKYKKYKLKRAPALPPQYEMMDPPEYKHKKGLQPDGQVWLGGVPRGTPKEILTEYDDLMIAKRTKGLTDDELYLYKLEGFISDYEKYTESPRVKRSEDKLFSTKNILHDLRYYLSLKENFRELASPTDKQIQNMEKANKRYASTIKDAEKHLKKKVINWKVNIDHNAEPYTGPSF